MRQYRLRPNRSFHPGKLVKQKRSQYARSGSAKHRGKPRTYRIDYECLAKIEANRRGRSATDSLTEIVGAYQIPIAPKE